MLGDIPVAKDIYIACGYTDMRKSIDGLAAVVQEQFHLDPFSKSLFLFCGKRRDRMKVLFWEGDGFILLYKRLENGNFKWPRKESEVRPISWKEFRWLMEGLELEQKEQLSLYPRALSADIKGVANAHVYWLCGTFCGIINSSK